MFYFNWGISVKFLWYFILRIGLRKFLRINLTTNIKNDDLIILHLREELGEEFLLLGEERLSALTKGSSPERLLTCK